ncbi:MAG: hypothetical protein HUU31_25180 [Anaerolineae bacterium]|nr:hypothetical protein [Anaerolineae bacterium]
MVNRLARALLALAILLASCGAPPGTTDWCYTYDLDYGPPDLYGMTTNGQWVEDVGVYSLHELTPVDQHLLTMSLTHDTPVNATMVSFTAGRESSSVSMNVAGSLQVFNLVQENFGYYIPYGVGLGEMFMTPTTVGSASQDLNISIAAEDEFYIKAITLWGYGANPFGTSNCDQIIPLETPPGTSEPSATATEPTGPEPTATATWTPSLTPTPSHWCTEFNFASSSGGWLAWHGSYSAGTGFISDLYVYPATAYLRSAGIHNNFVSYYTVTSIDLGYELLSTGSFTPVVAGAQIWTDSITNLLSSEAVSSGPQTLSWAGVKSMNNINMRAIAGYDSIYPLVDPTGSAVITYLKMEGTGPVGPWGASNCATPTPTPTNTPTNTNTPAPSATSTDTPVPTLNRTQTITPIPSVTRTASATRTHVFTTTPSNTPGPATATRTASSTPAPATASRTPLPSPTIYGGPSATYLPTQTPGGATATPTGTPDPGGGGSAPDPGEVDFATYVSGFLNWAFNTLSGFFDYLGSLVNYGVGTAANIITTINNAIATIGELLSLVFAYITDILAILRMLIDLILMLIQLIAGWASQMIGAGEGIIVTWYVVPAEAIPGLPTCYSNPMSSDICAVYYVIQFTVLGGLLGSLIIIVLRVTLGVLMILYFVKTVRNYILKLQDMQAGG